MGLGWGYIGTWLREAESGRECGAGMCFVQNIDSINIVNYSA